MLVEGTAYERTTEDRVSRYSVSRFGMMYSVPMIAFGVTRWSLALTFRL